MVYVDTPREHHLLRNVTIQQIVMYYDRIE